MFFFVFAIHAESLLEFVEKSKKKVVSNKLIIFFPNTLLKLKRVKLETCKRVCDYLDLHTWPEMEVFQPNCNHSTPPYMCSIHHFYCKLFPKQ